MRREGAPPLLPQSVRRVVGRYVRAFAPERIMVFGSYAKGTHHPASDVDLLVIADLNTESAAHMRRARQLAADCFPSVDIIFATPEDVAGAADDPNPFLASILHSGVVVYAASAACASDTGHAETRTRMGRPTGT